MKSIFMLLCVLAVAGCATQKAPEPLPPPPEKEPNEIIIEQIRDSGLSAWETDKGVEIFLPDLLFEFNKAEVSERALGTLNVVANIVKKDVAKTRNIEVHGHTDATGPEEYNLLLSKKRALAVVEVLTSSGIPADRIKAEWFGEAKPKVQNYFTDGNFNKAGQSINRRVEVVILNNTSAE